MTNPTQRFFMVNVTGCEGCPHKLYSVIRDREFCGLGKGFDRFEILQQNFNAITPSCPMYPQSQEAEK